MAQSAWRARNLRMAATPISGWADSLDGTRRSARLGRIRFEHAPAGPRHRENSKAIQIRGNGVFGGIEVRTA